MKKPMTGHKLTQHLSHWVKGSLKAMKGSQTRHATPNQSSNPYHPVAIANYFVALAKTEHRPLDLLKLIKLVYLAHGWSLYFYSLPLIDEAPEAWVDGPVIPSVYHCFKEGNPKRMKKVANYVGREVKRHKTPTGLQSDTTTLTLLEKVWLGYRNLSGEDLSDLTHLPESAWEQTRTLKKLYRHPDIDEVLICQEFQTRFAEYGKKVHRPILALEDLRF